MLLHSLPCLLLTRAIHAWQDLSSHYMSFEDDCLTNSSGHQEPLGSFNKGGPAHSFTSCLHRAFILDELRVDGMRRICLELFQVLCNRVCIIMHNTCRRVWRGQFRVGQALDSLLVGPRISRVENQKGATPCS